MPPKESLYPADWVRIAERDLARVQYLLNAPDPEAAGFYLQQAVEKALKAFFIHVRQESPGPIHSLTKLARDLELPNHFRGFLRRLTGEYYLSRYPDAIGDLPFKAYDADDVREMSTLSHEVLQWLEQQISKS